MRTPASDRRGLVAAMVVTAAALSCTPSADVPRGIGDPHASSGDGVCGLLDPEEVELAVNRPLLGDVSRVDVPDAAASAGDADEVAEVELPDDIALPDVELPDDVEPPEGVDPPEEPAGDAPDDAAPASAGAGGARPLLPGMETCFVGSPDAGAVWGALTDDADEAFARYADWHDDYTTSARVDGHPAVWDARLRTIVVHAGEVVFALSLATDDPPLAEGEGEADYVADRVEELASRAIGRMR